MSPVSSSNVRDRGARVQAPFTSSDTWTCPGAWYCETHATSRSPWVTGWLRVTAASSVGAVENAVPWTKVGVVDWATAVRGRTVARAAIRARRAADRAECKRFTVNPSFTRARAGGWSSSAGLHWAPDRPLLGSRLPSVGSTTQKPLPCHCGAEAGQDDCSLTLLRRGQEGKQSPRRRVSPVPLEPCLTSSGDG